jgi:hypothetical protein
LYWLTHITARPAVASGLCLLVGFVGAVAGIVYGWPYYLERVWFIAWCVGALYFAFSGMRRWFQVKLDAADYESRTVPKPAPSRRLEGTRLKSAAAIRETSDTRRAEPGHPDVSI